MRNGLKLGLAALVASAVVGCTTQQAYDDTIEANRALQERNTLLAQRLDESEATVRQQADQLVRNERAIGDLQKSNTGLRDQIVQLQGSLEGFDQRFGDLAFGPLDPETDRALAELARKHPNMVTYDASRGMLRFTSDLTFGSGSDEVTPAAKTGLIELANVLKSSAGSAYEIHIIGHTDSQPISNAATRAKHPTNMHLSAHRAISVRGILRDAGVPASTMQAAGWGEHRPLVPNAATGGTAANRRVEIYLTRPTGTPSGTADATVDATAAPERPYETTK